MNYLGLLLKVKGGQSERFEIDPPPDGILGRTGDFSLRDRRQSLADEMVYEIGKTKIKLNTEVTQIDIRTQDVQLTTRSVTKGGSASENFQICDTGYPSQRLAQSDHPPQWQHHRPQYGDWRDGDGPSREVLQPF